MAETRTHRHPALIAARRLPFTGSVLLAMVAAGVATGSLWTPSADQPWFPMVGYGLPALTDGRWWTLVTGAFFALNPAFYLPVVGVFALLVGVAEWRMGTARAAAICVAGQLVGVLGAALTMLLLGSSGWPWATALAADLDVGFSAGALACGAALTAALPAPWRLRLVAGLFGYVAVSALFLGSLADLEHLWAVAVALPLSRRLVGPHAVPGPMWAGRRNRRLLAATGVALIALTELVLVLFPADSPLGPTFDPDASLLSALVTVAVAALVVDGLRKGRRVAWSVALALSALNVGARLVEVLSGPGATAFAVAAAVIWGVELAVLVAFRDAFAAPRSASVAADHDGARRLLAEHGGGTLSWMATWPSNAHFRSRDGSSIVAFQRHAGVAIGLGDPIGDPARHSDAIHDFTAVCERSGLVPCLFSVGAATVAATGDLGWHHVRIAEDTLIDLPGLEFRGKRWQDVRSALNRAAAEGITYREVVLADEPWAVRAQVRAISEGWVGDKGMPEMAFTLGGVEEATDPAVTVGLAVDADGSIHGVTSWLPVHGPGGTVHGWTLDLMRRRDGGFRPVIEFLIASACRAFQERGALFVSLSGAPLARNGDETGGQAVERLLDTLGAAMEPYYGFRSLHAFKGKFSPRYEPLFLAYRDEGDLPRIGIALAKAYLPRADLRDFVRLATGRGG